ncbi:hypothetical protein ACTFIU_007324 [Dictyostelium citrinum]
MSINDNIKNHNNTNSANPNNNKNKNNNNSNNNKNRNNKNNNINNTNNNNNLNNSNINNNNINNDINNSDTYNNNNKNKNKMSPIKIENIENTNGKIELNNRIIAPPPPPPPSLISKKCISQNDSKNKTELTKSILSSTESMKTLLESFQRNNLSKTKTKVRTADGRVYEEQLSDSGHLIEYKGLDESTSIKIYKEKTQLTSFNYCEKFQQWIPYSHISNIILPTTTSTATTTTNTTSTITTTTTTANTNINSINISTSSLNSNDSTSLVFEDKILTFLTFNVWFDSYLWKQRANRLFKTIESKNPDVICLQEVTPMFLDYLKDQKWVRERYCISDNGDLDTVYPYGVVILFKYDTMVLKQMSLCPLPNSNQSRKMISSIFSINNCNSINDINNTNTTNNNNNISLTTSNTSNSSNINNNNNNNNILISISTVHLESLDINTEPRIKQFNMVSDFIDKSNIAFGTNLIKHHFILGDFNFGSNSRENLEISKRGFNDLWKDLNNINNNDNNETVKENEGFTYVKKPKRVDRVLFKSLDMFESSIKLEPQSLSLIGFEPVEIDSNTRLLENIPLDEHIYPSDHFGLFATYKFSQKK